MIASWIFPMTISALLINLTFKYHNQTMHINKITVSTHVEFLLPNNTRFQLIVEVSEQLMTNLSK